MTSRNLYYYFRTFSKILHHQLVIHQSTMVKQSETPSLPSSPSKFPKSNSLSSLKTQPQFSIKKLPFSRKVSEEQKQRLVQLITASNYNMMDAAKAVKISYSSAKKIFTRFRRTLREEIKRKTKNRHCTIRAAYAFVKSDSSLQPTRVESVSLIAGVKQGWEQDGEVFEEIDC